jgi:hypothetical protein
MGYTHLQPLLSGTTLPLMPRSPATAHMTPSRYLPALSLDPPMISNRYFIMYSYYHHNHGNEFMAIIVNILGVPIQHVPI